MDEARPGTWPAIIVLAVAVAAAAVTRSRRVALPLDGAAPARLPAVRIDLNSAPAAALVLLPGVGPRLAERIEADRAARGPFASVEDLARVSGVGPVTLEAIKGLAVAGETADYDQ